MYFKSIYTGQVYKLDFVPQYGGYEEVTEKEYNEYCERMGL